MLHTQSLTQQTALHPGGLHGQRTAILSLNPVDPWLPLLSEPGLKNTIAPLLYDIHNYLIMLLSNECSGVNSKSFTVQKRYIRYILVSYPGLGTRLGPFYFVY